MSVPLFLLSGPTASGKTDFAHRLADRMGLRLLSVDSMMVYRGMDIGTAKPPPEELRAHAYAGLNLVDPGTPFSVGDWLRAADHQLDDRPTLAVGGTGLYFRALTQGLEEDDVPTPDDLPGDVPGLQARLRKADPEALARLADPENPRRLARAIAWREAGRPLPENAARVPPPVIPVLVRPTPDLAARIEQRAERMFAEGLLDETQRLLDSGRLAGTAAGAIGYTEAAACLRGECSRTEAVQRTAARTRKYAKRQRTWFRNQMRAEWIDATRPTEDVVAAIESAWTRNPTYR